MSISSGGCPLFLSGSGITTANLLTTLASETIISCDSDPLSVSIIDLSDNDISELPAALFGTYPNIYELSLNNNSFTSWPVFPYAISTVNADTQLIANASIPADQKAVCDSFAQFGCFTAFNRQFGYCTDDAGCFECIWTGFRNEISAVNLELSGSLQLEADLTIPALSALTNLYRLAVYGGSGNLQGTIPDLSSLVNLEQITLDSQFLTGTIPSMAANTELRRVEFPGNRLTGTLPAIGSSKLHTLDVENNFLTGTAASVFADISQLSTCRLAGNSWSELSAELRAAPCNGVLHNCGSANGGNCMDEGYLPRYQGTACDGCISKGTTNKAECCVVSAPTNFELLEIRYSNPSNYIDDTSEFRVEELRDCVHKCENMPGFSSLDKDDNIVQCISFLYLDLPASVAPSFNNCILYSCSLYYEDCALTPPPTASPTVSPTGKPSAPPTLGTPIPSFSPSPNPTTANPTSAPTTLLPEIPDGQGGNFAQFGLYERRGHWLIQSKVHLHISSPSAAGCGEAVVDACQAFAEIGKADSRDPALPQWKTLDLYTVDQLDYEWEFYCAASPLPLQDPAYTSITSGPYILPDNTECSLSLTQSLIQTCSEENIGLGLYPRVLAVARARAFMNLGRRRLQGGFVAGSFNTRVIAAIDAKQSQGLFLTSTLDLPVKSKFHLPVSIKADTKVVNGNCSQPGPSSLSYPTCPLQYSWNVSPLGGGGEGAYSFDSSGAFTSTVDFTGSFLSLPANFFSPQASGRPRPFQGQPAVFCDANTVSAQLKDSACFCDHNHDPDSTDPECVALRPEMSGKEDVIKYEVVLKISTTQDPSCPPAELTTIARGLLNFERPEVVVSAKYNYSGMPSSWLQPRAVQSPFILVEESLVQDGTIPTVTFQASSFLSAPLPASNSIRYTWNCYPTEATYFNLAYEPADSMFSFSMPDLTGLHQQWVPSGGRTSCGADFESSDPDGPATLTLNMSYPGDPWDVVFVTVEAHVVPSVWKNWTFDQRNCDPHLNFLTNVETCDKGSFSVNNGILGTSEFCFCDALHQVTQPSTSTTYDPDCFHPSHVEQQGSCRAYSPFSPNLADILPAFTSDTAAEPALRALQGQAFEGEDFLSWENFQFAASSCLSLEGSPLSAQFYETDRMAPSTLLASPGRQVFAVTKGFGDPLGPQVFPVLLSADWPSKGNIQTNLLRSWQTHLVNAATDAIEFSLDFSFNQDYDSYQLSLRAHQAPVEAPGLSSGSLSCPNFDLGSSITNEQSTTAGLTPALGYSKRHRISFTLPAGSLVPGCSYTITAGVSMQLEESEGGYSQVFLNTFTPPEDRSGPGGPFIVSNAPIDASYRTFDLQASDGWFDVHAPLSYRFYYREASSPKSSRIPINSSPQFSAQMRTFQLPVGFLTLSLQVLDWLGGSADYVEVNVTSGVLTGGVDGDGNPVFEPPAALNCSQVQAQYAAYTASGDLSSVAVLLAENNVDNDGSLCIEPGAALSTLAASAAACSDAASAETSVRAANDLLTNAGSASSGLPSPAPANSPTPSSPSISPGVPVSKRDPALQAESDLLVEVGLASVYASWNSRKTNEAKSTQVVQNVKELADKVAQTYRCNGLARVKQLAQALLEYDVSDVTNTSASSSFNSQGMAFVVQRGERSSGQVRTSLLSSEVQLPLGELSLNIVDLMVLQVDFLCNAVNKPGIQVNSATLSIQALVPGFTSSLAKQELEVSGLSSPVVFNMQLKGPDPEDADQLSSEAGREVAARVLAILDSQAVFDDYKLGNFVKCSWLTDEEEWSTSGCEAVALSSSGLVTCSCDHLTDFVLLFDRTAAEAAEVNTPPGWVFGLFLAFYVLATLLALRQLLFIAFPAKSFAFGHPKVKPLLSGEPKSRTQSKAQPSTTVSASAASSLGPSGAVSSGASEGNKTFKSSSKSAKRQQPHRHYHKPKKTKVAVSTKILGFEHLLIGLMGLFRIIYCITGIVGGGAETPQEVIALLVVGARALLNMLMSLVWLSWMGVYMQIHTLQNNAKPLIIRHKTKYLVANSVWACLAAVLVIAGVFDEDVLGAAQVICGTTSLALCLGLCFTGTMLLLELKKAKGGKRNTIKAVQRRLNITVAGIGLSLFAYAVLQFVSAAATLGGEPATKGEATLQLVLFFMAELTMLGMAFYLLWAPVRTMRNKAIGLKSSQAASGQASKTIGSSSAPVRKQSAAFSTANFKMSVVPPPTKSSVRQSAIQLDRSKTDDTERKTGWIEEEAKEDNDPNKPMLGLLPKLGPLPPVLGLPKPEKPASGAKPEHSRSRSNFVPVEHEKSWNSSPRIVASVADAKVGSTVTTSPGKKS